MKKNLLALLLCIFAATAFANNSYNFCRYGHLKIYIHNKSTHLPSLDGRIAITGEGGYPDKHFSVKTGDHHTYTFTTEADGCWIQGSQEIGEPPLIFQKITTKHIKKHWFDEKLVTYQIPLDLQKQGLSFRIYITAYNYQKHGVCIEAKTHYPDGHSSGTLRCFD